MIETIDYRGEIYPALQASGNAARFAIPFAKEFCKGEGVDIGCYKPEWSFPGSFIVEPQLGLHDAMKFPLLSEANNNGECGWDYIFSSHCLEHLPNYVAALDYWSTRLRKGGVLFLYLPDMSMQRYWRPTNNRKHIHYIDPNVMQLYFADRPEMWRKAFVSRFDLNYSFYCVAEKK